MSHLFDCPPNCVVGNCVVMRQGSDSCVISASEIWWECHASPRQSARAILVEQTLGNVATVYQFALLKNQ